VPESQDKNIFLSRPESRQPLTISDLRWYFAKFDADNTATGLREVIWGYAPKNVRRLPMKRCSV